MVKGIELYFSFHISNALQKQHKIFPPIERKHSNAAINTKTKYCEELTFFYIHIFLLVLWIHVCIW